MTNKRKIEIAIVLEELARHEDFKELARTAIAMAQELREEVKTDTIINNA